MRWGVNHEKCVGKIWKQGIVAHLKALFWNSSEGTGVNNEKPSHDSRQSIAWKCDKFHIAGAVITKRNVICDEPAAPLRTAYFPAPWAPKTGSLSCHGRVNEQRWRVHVLHFFKSMCKPIWCCRCQTALVHLAPCINRTLKDTKMSKFKNESFIRWCIQKFPDWPPGARTANGTAFCHYVQLYLYFVSQSSAFCRHNPLCCFSTSNTKGKRIFRYRLSPETFWYTLITT